MNAGGMKLFLCVRKHLRVVECLEAASNSRGNLVSTELCEKHGAIFTEDLVGHFPEARVLWAPPACGEDLAIKMPGLAGRAELLVNGMSQLGSDLEVRSFKIIVVCR